ncbi:MAG: cupin domain-containing protein, partial [Motiliproteus sp.]
MTAIYPLSHLGDIPVETFLAEYWHKKPLLVRQAFSDLSLPVTADELAGLACEEGVESRLLVETPATGDWQLRHGPFAESVFAELPKECWTLLVQAVDHWVPEAADFVEQFRFIPSWRMDDLMISYAAKGGGVGPHYDNYDVFLLQTEGQRRWDIGGCYDEGSEFVPDKPVRILKNWQPEQSWVLNPGDMLYLPPRVGHNGVAESDGCMTYSVGYRAPQNGDMLMHFASYCAGGMTDEDRYADPDLSLR